MEELLLKWGFDELIIQNFLENEIEVDQLENLTEDYIKELVPKIGDRLKLKKKITQLSNIAKSPSSIVNEASCSMHLIAYPNVKKFHKHVNIMKILARNGEGKRAMEYFSMKNFLLPIHRNYITRCLVDYYIDQFRTMSSNDFSILAHEIAKKFPDEKKEIYFCPGETINGKRIPNKGKLVDRYYNVKRNLDNKGAKKRKVATGVLNMQSEDVDDVDTDEMKTFKEILSYQQIHSEENVEMWKKCFKLRRCEFLAQDGSKVEEVLNNWPILRTSFATKLIEIDFEATFPSKSRCVFDKWQTFSNGIVRLFSEIKDRRGLQLAQVLINGNLTPETYNFYLLYLLPYVVKPTTNLISNDDSIKPSIAESRDSFIVKVHTINNLQVHIDAYVKLQKKRGLIVKPLIIAVGTDEITDVFLVCETVKYKCLTVIEALSLCFQLHITFNISFSKESIQIWTLIRKFFFLIESDLDLELTTVNSVLATLNEMSFV